VDLVVHRLDQQQDQRSCANEEQADGGEASPVNPAPEGF